MGLVQGQGQNTGAHGNGEPVRGELTDNFANRRGLRSESDALNGDAHVELLHVGIEVSIGWRISAPSPADRRPGALVNVVERGRLARSIETAISTACDGWVG
jgi:hypothetical protein